MTDIFIDRTSNEAVDRESFQRSFLINFDEDKMTTSIPSTKEKIASNITFKQRLIDRTINDFVIQFRVLNPYTNREETYLLLEKEAGGYSLFQELPETNMRIFFSPDSRCVH